jgi:hypothetical protein
MTSDSWIWTELRDFFDTDDGSLPEIRITYTKPGAAAAGYALLRQLASRVVTIDPYCSTARGPISLDSVPNAAELVASGEAEPFHIVLAGITIRDTSLPDLGVFTFDDQLALDYRMGPNWNAGRLEALFEVIRQLLVLDQSASIRLEPGVDPDYEARFVRAFDSWRSYESA